MNNIKFKIGTALGLIGTLALSLKAGAVTSTAEIASSFGSILTSIVDEVTDVTVTFLTSNWPLIATLSVTIGLVFFLYYKLRGAIRGR